MPAGVDALIQSCIMCTGRMQGPCVCVCTQSLTVTPMFLAVPSTMRMAASTVTAFRSGSLISAISCKGPVYIQ